MSTLDTPSQASEPEAKVVPRASEDSDAHIIGSKSMGVKRIEAISAQFTGLNRIFLFFSIFLVAYAYGLDGTIRYTYQVRLSLLVLGLSYGVWAQECFI